MRIISIMLICVMALAGCVTTRSEDGSVTTELDFVQLTRAYQLAKLIYDDLKAEGIIGQEEQEEESSFYEDLLAIIKVKILEGLSDVEIRDLLNRQKSEM